MQRTTSETCFNNYHTPKNVAEFASDVESHVLQNSIYVAMGTSVAATFSDPIANVQGLAFLAWANKVDWNSEKHRHIPINIDKKWLFIVHYKQSRVSSSYQSSLNMFKQVCTYGKFVTEDGRYVIELLFVFPFSLEKNSWSIFRSKSCDVIFIPIKFFDPFQSKHTNWESYIDVSSRVVICWCSVNLFVL